MQLGTCYQFYTLVGARARPPAMGGTMGPASINPGGSYKCRQALATSFRPWEVSPVQTGTRYQFYTLVGGTVPLSLRRGRQSTVPHTSGAPTDQRNVLQWPRVLPRIRKEGGFLP